MLLVDVEMLNVLPCPNHRDRSSQSARLQRCRGMEFDTDNRTACPTVRASPTPEMQPSTRLTPFRLGSAVRRAPTWTRLRPCFQPEVERPLGRPARPGEPH